MLIRLMQVADLGPCLARWPLPGVPAELARPVLESALAEQRLDGAVIQHLATGRLMGFGLSGFVRGAGVHRQVRAGQSLVAHLLHAESQAERVFLDSAARGRAQRVDDLHLVVVTYQQETVDALDPLAAELIHAGHTSFRLLHEGYALQAVWQEGWPSDAEWLCAGGFLVKHHEAGTPAQPRWLFGALREDVPAHWPSHTLSYVLRRNARRLGLSPSQCRVAELALWNLDDEEVARQMGIAPATVRRHWRTIFERLDASDVLKSERQVLALSSVGSLPDRRGPQRRRKVLDYLRSHLQEIRPA
jgi:DNA-binding CsgD family transcriptional regulator